MSYSGNKKVYGRKIVKGIIKDQSYFQRKLIMSWGICFAVGFLVGSLLIGAFTHFGKEEKTPYGSVDERVFTTEMSMDWSSGSELGFVPLDVPMDEDLQEFIYCLSYGYNIDFPFVMALMNHESGFQADVISSTNDFGLMQINKINHEWLTETLGVTDYLDPYENTRSGMFILRKLFEKYEDPAKVLMAYNLGETGAARLWKEDIFETAYSKKILETAAEFEQQISERKTNHD